MAETIVERLARIETKFDLMHETIAHHFEDNKLIATALSKLKLEVGTRLTTVENITDRVTTIQEVIANKVHNLEVSRAKAIGVALGIAAITGTSASIIFMLVIKVLGG